MPVATRCAALSLLILATACGDSGTSVTPDTQPTAPAPVVADPYPGVTAALTVNLNALPNFANPVVILNTNLCRSRCSTSRT